MLGNFFNSPEEFQSAKNLQNKLTQPNSWRMRNFSKQQKVNIQKRLFGQHYNYSKVGLNKQKKYFIQEQKNTEIERSNRILLQKLQRISKRSMPAQIKKRAFTLENDLQADKKESFYNKDTTIQDYQSRVSQQQLQKLDTLMFNTAKLQKKIVYSGSKQIQGKIYSIKIFIHKDKYNLQAESDQFKQNIKIDIRHYQKLLKKDLKGDPSKILEMLKYKGNIIELMNVKKQQITIQEKQQLILPQIGYSNKQQSQKEGTKQ